MFDFQSALNPQKRIFEADGTEGKVVLELAPFQTAQAFDANRWQALALSQRLIDADEFMFQIGLNRIIGWQGMKDAKGEDVPFSPDMLNAWSRLTKAIQYIQAVGKETLLEAGVLTLNEKKIELAAAEKAEEPTSEASESNTTTG